MMSNSVFLVDTNALITPYQQYYPFETASRVEKSQFLIWSNWNFKTVMKMIL